MEPRDFKNTILMLNTKNAGLIRRYYLNLEEAMFAYGEYTMKYMITQREQQLTIKDTEKEELKEQLDQEKEQRLKSEREAKERLERALKFNQTTKKVEPRDNRSILVGKQVQTWRLCVF